MLRLPRLTKARIIIILSFVFMLAYPSINGPAVAAVPSPAVNISNDVQPSSNPQVATSNNYVYTVWVAMLASGNTQVLFSRSSDFGATWSPPYNLSSDRGPASYARISAYGSNVYVLWDDKSAANNNSAVYFRASRNNGANWATVVNLSAPAPQPSRHFRFVAQGNNLYVAWVERLTGNNEILFTSSDDAGLDWIQPVDLSNDVNDSINIGLVVAGTNLFVVWMAQPPHFQILERSSSDRGVTWGNTVSISNDAGMAEAPDILAQGSGTNGRIYVIWQDNTTGTFQTMIRESQDNGANWGTSINLSHDTGKSVNPVIGGQTVGILNYVYVAWTDSTPGSNSAYFSVSKDGGKTFSGPIDLSPASYSATNLKLQVMPHGVLVLWQQTNLGASTVMVRASSDFGNTFGPAQNMGPGTGTSMSAFFNVSCGSAGRSYVIWVNPSSGNGDIYIQGMPAQADTLRLTQLPFGVTG